MINKILTLIGQKYPLTEIDCGEFTKMKISMMDFSISAYKAEGLGHISVMAAKGFFGLMKMDTLIINPTERDLPLYSYDRIFAMGNDTLIVELYDTISGEFSDERLQAAKAEYASLTEKDPGEHWYDAIKLPSSISKKGKSADTPKLDSLTLDHFKAYLQSTEAEGDRALKAEKSKLYVNGLIEKGGPSTDVFKKSIGEAKTRELFESILFGTK